MNPEDALRLPGPQSFVHRLTRDLERGVSVAVVFPDHAIESGLADAALDEIALRSPTSTSCDAASDNPFHTRVITSLGGDPTRDRDFDSWESMAGWPPLAGMCLVLAGWEHPDTAEILQRWPAQIHASGLDAADRPRMVLGLRGSCVDRLLLAGIDRDSMVVHWWWGVFDRLDTETRLVQVSGRNLGAIESAVIVETAGWDLDFVEHLAGDWDGSLTGLGPSIQRFATPRGEVAIPAIGNRSTSSTQPPSDLHRQWISGEVEWWGHCVIWGAMSLADADLGHRVWLAHNRTLIARVDDERAHFEALIREKARPEAIAELSMPADGPIEIGSLAWLVNSRRVDIGRSERLRLNFFKDVRNDLAHRRPLGDSRRRELGTYLKL